MREDGVGEATKKGRCPAPVVETKLWFVPSTMGAGFKMRLTVGAIGNKTLNPNEGCIGGIRLLSK